MSVVRMLPLHRVHTGVLSYSLRSFPHHPWVYNTWLRYPTGFLHVLRVKNPGDKGNRLNCPIRKCHHRHVDPVSPPPVPDVQANCHVEAQATVRNERVVQHSKGPP